MAMVRLLEDNGIVLVKENQSKPVTFARATQKDQAWAVNVVTPQDEGRTVTITITFTPN